MLNTNQARPIALDPRIESMRNKHLLAMKRMQSASARLKSTPEQRAEARKEYKEMRKDLIEFDTYFVGTNTACPRGDSSFSGKEGLYVVSLEDGKMYQSINEAAKKLGENRDTLRRAILAPNGTCHGFHWRYFDQKIELL